MPDFNKGDFTQQGVNGHVNATVRLNEKRLVNIDMTSNEEAEGCTITGTVKDLLNDKVYGIGSGVSGNIEITENGENINVAPYATATVNVSGGGGSDYSTAEVTILNPSGLPYNLAIPNIKEADGQRPAMLNNAITINQASKTIIVPLYKGACYVSISYLTNVFEEVTGQVSKISGTELFIEGNGTVTLVSDN